RHPESDSQSESYRALQCEPEKQPQTLDSMLRTYDPGGAGNVALGRRNRARPRAGMNGPRTSITRSSRAMSRLQQLHSERDAALCRLEHWKGLCGMREDRTSGGSVSPALEGAPGGQPDYWPGSRFPQWAYASILRPSRTTARNPAVPQRLPAQC